MAVFELTDSVIDPKELKTRMVAQEAGAFASFEGWVRNHNDGRDVLSLDYEVFEPLALSEGATIIAETMTRFDLIAARAIHRHGSLSLGDCAVWVGVTARHRGDAFDACRSIIDEIKHRLPIWKKEHYAEGPSQWVNCSHPSDNRGPASLAVDLRSYYDRQRRLPEVGAQGQEKLGRAKVLIVGLGGLGSSASLALAAAGVGTLGLLESDSLAATNLHRQILYSARDLGRAKVDLAEQRLSSQNPLIKIVKHAVRLSAANAENIIRPYDLILDCTDNFQTKYLLNDAAIILGKRLIQASIYRFEGHLLTIGPTSEGCLRCLWPTPPAAGAVGDCGEVGTLGTIPMVLGTLQANEAIKSILELAVPSESNLITFDLQSLTTTHLRRQHDAKCAVCGKSPTLTALNQEKPMDYEIFPGDDDSLVRYGQKFRIVDVREDHECRERPIVSDYRIPFSQFDASKLAAAPETPLLVVCEHGQRSLVVTSLLREKGWLNAFSLHTGLHGLELTRVYSTPDRAA